MSDGAANSPPAIDRFHADLNALKKLEPGWDGYKAPAISHAAIDLASQAYGRLHFLFGNHCQPVPGCGGEVQLEWHEHGFDVEVFISAQVCWNAWQARGRANEVVGVDAEVEKPLHVIKANGCSICGWDVFHCSAVQSLGKERTSQPEPVSLKACAEAIPASISNGSADYQDVAKAVLDAAGVKYK